jgi:hypothetical protein
MMLCIGYPTSIIDTFRKNYIEDLESKNKIDNASFWLFFFGIYKPLNENYF